MREIVEKAKELNPRFNELSTQKQFEFIKRNINKDVIKEELVWYYDSFFGTPYDTTILIRKHENRNKFKKV